MLSEETITRAGLVGEARCIWSLLLTLWPVGRPAGPRTRALQAGRTTTTLSMVRLCSLAEPTGPAQVSRAYLYLVSLGRGVFRDPARTLARARGLHEISHRPVQAAGCDARYGWCERGKGDRCSFHHFLRTLTITPHNIWVLFSARCLDSAPPELPAIQMQNTVGAF
jgi:hypothetical protein